MGKIIEGLFLWSVEDLRQEFCLEYENSKLMALRISQIKDKFKEINEMMDRQLEVNRRWDKNAQKSTTKPKDSMHNTRKPQSVLKCYYKDCNNQREIDSAYCPFHKGKTD